MPGAEPGTVGRILRRGHRGDGLWRGDHRLRNRGPPLLWRSRVQGCPWGTVDLHAASKAGRRTLLACDRVPGRTVPEGALPVRGVTDQLRRRVRRFADGCSPLRWLRYSLRRGAILLPGHVRGRWQRRLGLGRDRLLVSDRWRHLPGLADLAGCRSTGDAVRVIAPRRGQLRTLHQTLPMPAVRLRRRSDQVRRDARSDPRASRSSLPVDGKHHHPRQLPRRAMRGRRDALRAPMPTIRHPLPAGERFVRSLDRCLHHQTRPLLCPAISRVRLSETEQHRGGRQTCQGVRHHSQGTHVCAAPGFVACLGMRDSSPANEALQVELRELRELRVLPGCPMKGRPASGAPEAGCHVRSSGSTPRSGDRRSASSPAGQRLQSARRDGYGYPAPSAPSTASRCSTSRRRFHCRVARRYRR